jgi:signal transduction histidine kinase
MLDLAGITALAEEDVARAELLKRFSALLPFDCCRLYERQAGDDRICLTLDSRGAFPLDDPGREFGSQDGLIAWVIRTGKPLLLTDMHEFVTELTLDDKRLDNISNGPELRARDRQLRCARWEEVTARDAPLPFLAVPVVHPQQNVVLGALSASALVQPQHAHRVKPFSREDLNFATAFASAIAAVHWKARSTGISDLLTALASSTATTDLYRLTVDRLPALLHASAAHVYELTRERKLRLTHTNLVPEGGDGQAELPKIEYLLGVGKTGFAAKHRVTIVLNYFGDDALDQRELEQERARIVTEQPDDLALDALDQEGRAVGLAQVRGGARLTAEGLEQLRQLAHDSLRMTGNGIVPSKHEAHRRLGPPERWALVIAPMLGDGAVYGVLTLARSVPYERFSEADVDLVEKIAHRLGEAAHGRKLAAEREQTLAFLAHEFRTPIASMKSHLHLIQGSFPPFAQSEARRKVGESLDQLERLRILSQSIILNASGAIQECQFVERELYPVLSEACRLFRLEANDRGFDIKEPFCRGGPFPKIDMAVDWLELAFKNLLHNAVKYSLPGPVRFSRYVSVMGEFVEPERTHFSVSISNLGIGIDPEDYDNVFLPFWRSERARRTHRTGAGLGLNIVQRIVAELHGGRISVTSEPRQSGAHLTVFTVTLPVRQPAKTGRF